MAARQIRHAAQFISSTPIPAVTASFFRIRRSARRPSNAAHSVIEARKRLAAGEHSHLYVAARAATPHRRSLRPSVKSGLARESHCRRDPLRRGRLIEHVPIDEVARATKASAPTCSIRGVRRRLIRPAREGGLATAGLRPGWTRKSSARRLARREARGRQCARVVRA